MGTFIDGRVSDKEREDHHIFLWGTQGVCQTDYLTTADQKIPDWMALRWHSPEKLKLQLGQVLSLGLLTQGLAQVTLFRAWCLFF